MATTTKRLTKAEREAAQKAALRQRIGDIVAGACGQEKDTEGEIVFLCEYPNVLRAVKARLELPADREHLTSAHNADAYETVEKLTEFLFRNGVRA